MTLPSDTPLSRFLHRWLDQLTWPKLAVIGLIVLVARRPESVFAAEFTWEEANAFYIPTFFLDPVAQLRETWGGTFQVVPRIGYLVLRAIPAFWTPLAENLLALIAPLVVAGFIASRRLATVVADRHLRLGFAAMLLLLPAQRGVMGVLLNAQWWGGLWLILLPLAANPVTPAGRWIERGVVALVALSGPFSTLLAPAFLWQLRSRRTRHDLWLAAIVVCGGIIQLIAILTSGRAEVVDTRPADLTFVTFWLHAAIVPMLGERLSNALGSSGVPAAILFVGGVAMVASLALTAWRWMPRTALPLFYGAVVVGLSGIVIHGGANVWPPGANERYFLPAAALTVAIVTAGLIRRRRLAAILAVMLGVGVLTDFRLDPYPLQGWGETYSCVGSEEACVIPIWPPGYEVYWPGIDGHYDMPDHVDP